ncbi:MAG: hypothetical protein KDB14_23625 [Planctomycetales bacterium]|nr:hypothetical protein [Planctomycetales bacterium]
MITTNVKSTAGSAVLQRLPRKPARLRWAVGLAIVATTSLAQAAEPALANGKTQAFRGAMLSAEQVTDERLATLRSSGIGAIALELRGGDQRERERKACQRIVAANLDLCYWIEVARCKELADQHPAWMASLQGHQEWRRLFKDPPVPGENEVVKVHPWVPILNQEPFQAQLDRVRGLLESLPAAKVVFLNDLQGAPSACGCGNNLCRWTSDYGKIRTSTPIEKDAAQAFVVAVKKTASTSRIIPVWTTECEEADGAHDGPCAGVGCYRGICWKAYTKQLTPVAEQCETLGVLLPYRDWGRDLPRYGEPAGWIESAVTSFAVMPARHQAEPVSASRLIAVVQGWDVTETQLNQQLEAARRSGVSGVLVCFAKVEQAWQPRLYRWK